MFTKRTFFLLFTIVAIVAAGAITVSAQDTTTPVQPPFGGRGQGMLTQSRLLWDSDTAPTYSAIADALGIDPEALYAELQSGTTLAELAAEYGVDLDTVIAAQRTATQEHLQAMVDAGLMTQEQATARLALMEQRWEDMPMLYNNYNYGYNMGTGRGGMWNDDSTGSTTTPGTMGGGMMGSGSNGASRGGGMGRGGR